MITQIANREQTAHLSARLQPTRAEFVLSADSLPYQALQGPGFERLCYLLLLARGHSPLFFGASGDPDYGIDLLVDGDGERVVYQCKNVAKFSISDAIDALKKFELEWLQQTHLAKPKKFVLCLTRSLRNLKDLERWLTYSEEFSQKHQIEVGTPWDRTYLNETLKRLPDIVAEVFSDQIAELFCERDDWDFDQFHPLAENATEPSLKRYFARKAADRLYIDSERIIEFTEKLERNGSVLIKGLPGSGKTITSLALTEELTRYRVYYLSLRENVTSDLLVTGIKDRLSRRTIFVVDDCQGKFAQLDSLMIRIRRLLQGRPLNQALFVFLTRTTPTPDDLKRGDEITGFEEDLKQAGAVMEFVTNRQTFRQIIKQSKPEFADLTPERLASLYDFTGHDLFLLDQLLDTLDDPQGLDDLNLESLFGKTLARYFRADAVDRPGFMHLAALAQFDLAPRASAFPYNLKAEDARASELIAEAGQPLHYFLLHSSAAELIFRALALSHGIKDHINEAVDHLTAFFKGRTPDDLTLSDDLAKAIRNRLKLVEETDGERLKSGFLADEAIYELIERNFAALQLNVLAVCCVILRNTSSVALERYEGLIRRKVEDGTVLQLATTKPFWEGSLFLRLTKRYYPSVLNTLRNQVAAIGLRSLVQTTELQNFLALLSMVAEPDGVYWHNSLRLVPDGEIEEMVARTLTAGRPIGTLHQALRELQETDEVLLTDLEEKIGGARWLRLVTATGTLFELFRVIENSSLTLARELIVALDEELVEQLVAQTITAHRSIGNINWALRELKQNNEALLRQLEEKIGAAQWLRLIAANGTLFELFGLIKYSTLTLAEELIAGFDEKLVEQLIAQTLSAGRSIGTLHLALRELHGNDEALLIDLEEKIGAARWLRLIAANGTLFELFRVIENSTLTLAEELIVALDEKLVEQLVAQTITAQRSIGNINWALRELKQNNEKLLRQLEEKIGAARWLRLIAANGTLFELFKVIENCTLLLAEELIAALDEKLVEQLIAQTITAERSIGNINWALRELKQNNERLLRQLEEKIGAPRWLRLISANGTLFELFRVIENSTLTQADELIAALDETLVEQLTAQTLAAHRSIGTLHWTLRYLKRANGVLLSDLEKKIGIKRWWKLICSFGSIAILVDLLPALDRSFQQKFIQAAKALSAAEWNELLRQNGFQELCYLVRKCPWFFTERFRPIALKPILVALVEASNWEARYLGWINLLNAPDSVGKRDLLELVNKQFTWVQADGLRFPNFSEAAHSVSLLWRLRPELQKELADALWTFIETNDPIYTDANYLRNAGLLLAAWTITGAKRPTDARSLLSLANDSAVAEVCVTAKTLDLFFYLWNLYALWLAWKSGKENSFAEFLNAQLKNAVIERLRPLMAAAKNQKDRDSLIALVGVMSFIGVSPDRSLALENFLSKCPSEDEMIFGIAPTRPFISSIFFLLGLEWMFEDDGAVPPLVWREQLVKAKNYPEATAALEQVTSLVTLRSN